MPIIRIFIIYAHENSSDADRIYNALALHPELDPWLDRKKLQPGENWKYVIRKNIDESDFIIILLSSLSINKTGFVQSEIKEALEYALMRPPSSRFIIPVRLDNCSPSYPELSKLQYLDLFPDWFDGMNRLCNIFGVKHFTHQYVARGFHEREIPYLISVEQQANDEFDAIQLVDISSLPKIEAKLVPDKGMKRDNIETSWFLKLWTIASNNWGKLYRKSDWNTMDEILFCEQRSEAQKQILVEVLIRQWALAKQLALYNEDEWRTLRSYIQQPDFGNTIEKRE